MQRQKEAGARRVPGAPMPVPAAPPPQAGGLLPRTAEDLAAERGGFAGWCGPAVVALASGRSYAEASALIRGAAPEHYPAGDADLVTAYWRDLIAALARAAVPTEALAVPAGPGTAARRPTLLGLARAGGGGGDGLALGWYLVRVSGHFLLLRLHGFGLAQVFDNRLSGAVLTARTHGRCRVTHLARILGGPLLAGGPVS